ncbi:MAG: FtsW/RodA/SpoVE family cell cycle protein [Anaerolineae bacterium]|nr:FtsW/RodA/SpoVE family cell cycle protein [Anaerolineae bacterium]
MSESCAPSPDDSFVHMQRERTLLLIATCFLIAGSITLEVARPPGAPLYSLLTIAAFISCFVGAHCSLNRYLPRRDPFLLPVASLLTGWGLLMIRRLAVNFLLRQTAWVVVSTGALLLIARREDVLRSLRRFRYTWLFGGLLLLAATLIFGVNPSGYGPRLWLGGWGLYFQPAELLKLLLIAYLASYLAERRELLLSEKWKVGRWHLPPPAYIGPLVAMLGLALILLAWQQDLGAAMLFFFTFLVMLFLTTRQWGYIAAGLALFIAMGIPAYHLSERVALRIDGWLNPWPDAADRTFQIVQSLLAFGVGGIFGQGLGLGSPTFIPAVHTDFVFAAIGEEFGLTGVLAIVALYGVLLLRGFRIAARAPRLFERFLAAGLTSGLVIQAWVIMAGNARLAPIAGVTLPFVSYGGSSLLMSFVTLALLLRISATAETPVLTGNRPVNIPLPLVGGVLAAALALLALVCGYWAVVRAEALRARADNPRRVLYEQRIIRGRILDRNGSVLAYMEADAHGRLVRRYPVPEAAPVVGYASLRHGTGGIEAALDAALRGEARRPAWQAALDELLHRPPQGSDIQLTLDAALQALAQRSLKGRPGTAVILDVRTGEVLALASAPTFDPQRLDEEWERLRVDPAAPLINRATQGLYQPGAALQTVILATALEKQPAILSTSFPYADVPVYVDGVPLRCAAQPKEPYTLATAYTAACPAPFAALGEAAGTTGLREAFDRWGLTVPPVLELPTAAASLEIANPRAEAIGQGSLLVSPLHVALVAATLANEGIMPSPHLVARVQKEPRGEWLEHHTAGEERRIITPDIARAIVRNWEYRENGIAHWGIALSGKGRPPHAWFMGLTLAGGARYAVVVLLEHATRPEQVLEIGETLLKACR